MSQATTFWRLAGMTYLEVRDKSGSDRQERRVSVPPSTVGISRRFCAEPSARRAAGSHRHMAEQQGDGDSRRIPFPEARAMDVFRRECRSAWWSAHVVLHTPPRFFCPCTPSETNTRSCVHAH
ncbi:unnamed protein product [Scytosiphon promiscuus]